MEYDCEFEILVSASVFAGGQHFQFFPIPPNVLISQMTYDVICILILFYPNSLFNLLNKSNTYCYLLVC